MATYKVGYILYEFIMESNSIPWYRNQDFVISKINTVTNTYELRGTYDNYPRFYPKEQLDVFFRIRRTC